MIIVWGGWRGTRNTCMYEMSEMFTVPMSKAAASQLTKVRKKLIWLMIVARQQCPPKKHHLPTNSSAAPVCLLICFLLFKWWRWRLVHSSSSCLLHVGWVQAPANFTVTQEKCFNESHWSIIIKKKIKMQKTSGAFHGVQGSLHGMQRISFEQKWLQMLRPR